jgi:chromosome segregation protein
MPAAADATSKARIAGLQATRDRLAGLLVESDAAREAASRHHAAAEAATALARSRLASLDAAVIELAEREVRLDRERSSLARDQALADAVAADARTALEALLARDSDDRRALAAAELAAATAREAVSVAQARQQAADHEALEARLALESVREQVLVELAGLGQIGLRHLGAADHPDAANTATAEASDGDEDRLAQLVDAIAPTWAQTVPPEAPGPGRLAALRRRFHELGAGNPFAVEEYAEVKARLDALETQRADLQAAIERTRALIVELDTLIATQFRATFEALERAFERRFQDLFGGGYAKLSLTDPADLAATGVEIIARPPGKKPQPLAMLSGGERALTAVALLFAMLEVRPVPFCVLDEVDAALDEANIGRFTAALRELSTRTQCIVITHNRGTIETADALYGVTVGEDSVSRVISLRLEDATKLAATATAEAVPQAVG